MVAVVTLSQDRVAQFISVNGLEGPIEDLVKTKEIEFGVLKQLQRVAEMKNLDKVERIVRVHIVSEPFTTEKGLLTSTQKMRRPVI